jgi:hypothetical protein
MVHPIFEARTFSDGVKPLVTYTQCLIRKLTIAPPAVETTRRVLAVVLFRITGLMLAVLIFATGIAAKKITCVSHLWCFRFTRLMTY